MRQSGWLAGRLPSWLGAICLSPKKHNSNDARLWWEKWIWMLCSILLFRLWVQIDPHLEKSLRIDVSNLQKGIFSIFYHSDRAIGCSELTALSFTDSDSLLRERERAKLPELAGPCVAEKLSCVALINKLVAKSSACVHFVVGELLVGMTWALSLSSLTIVVI